MAVITCVLVVLAGINPFALLRLLWEGFQLIGAAFIGMFKALLGAFGLSVPDWALQIATIGALILVMLKWGKHIGKIILIVLLLLLASTFVQLLIPRF